MRIKRRQVVVRQMPKIYGNLQPKRRRSFPGLFKNLRIFLIVAISFGLLYIFIASPVFQVKKVEVQGAILVNATETQALIPLRTSIWHIPKRDIEQKLLAQPTVISVGIFRGLPDSVRIVINERQPVLSWQTGDALYLIDSDGYSYAQFPLSALPGPETSAGQKIAQVPKVVDTKALPVQLNTPIASRTFLTFLTGMKEALTQYLPEISLHQLEITDTTYDLTYVSDQGMQVVFNTLADPAVEVRNLARMVTQHDADPAHSHVDLRIDHWAYVR